ncbi:hypothetical protein BS47DRAFT_1371638 [Hydnum rufescens UP504]|uniref:ATP-binding cassette transporter n=1 Tax=Hydnum rufescens UP504 TaxID=1448309 RepID=A0A9P6E048_9AGAM|nr:hypothetical protein BS47DRAFT_1371638 [Hydnum rufescens UP504]
MSSQIFFTPTLHPIPLWREPLFVPVYFSALSALVLVLRLLSRVECIRNVVNRIRCSDTDPNVKDDRYNLPTSPEDVGFFVELKQRMKQHGGIFPFSLKIARVLCCVALLAISIVAFLRDEAEEIDGRALIAPLRKGWRGHRKKKHPHDSERQREYFRHEEWIEVAMCAFYMYASLLAFLTLTTRPRIRGHIGTHLSVLLFAVFCMYGYRDLWPLATFTLDPVDAAGGWLTWSRITLLGLASILPLVTPRIYVPIDPLNPNDPLPEQTASPLSFMTFAFMDPTVKTAYKYPHLPYDRLPPLADYDRSTYLKAKSFPKLDPMLLQKPRYLLFGLLSHFRNEYLWLAFMITLRAIIPFASPIAVNCLLRPVPYIETGGEKAVVRPWFWAIVLFLAPTMSSVVMQLYIFVAGILTQLIFEHSLRIRMKEDTPPKAAKPDTAPSSTPASPRPRGTNLPSVEDSSDASQPVSEPTDTEGTTAVSLDESATKDRAEQDSPTLDAKDKESKSSNLVGKINNLISTDLENITEGRDFFFIFLFAPINIILCSVFLYVLLDWSGIVGILVMVLAFPIPGKIASMVHVVQVQRMKKARMHHACFGRSTHLHLAMNVLRMIKMFGWESKIGEQMGVRRENELVWIKKRFYLTLANMVFSALTVFDMLRDQLHVAFYFIPPMIQAKVSVDRVDGVWIHSPGMDPEAIGFRNSTFTWSKSVGGAPLEAPVTPSRRHFRLRVEGDLFFHKGGLNLIVGPTGSGKTSLLLALLGELHFSPPGPDSWYNIPRDGGVAYSAQEPWILNETIKENILFGQPLEVDRYKKVLYQCALDRDLGLFDAGDETEVGEKGLTLRRARISLARAVYSKAEVVLLDDVLSALDVHTSRWIVDQCLVGDLLRSRTVILVTHNVAMTGPFAQFVVSIGSNGRIASQGTIGDALSKNKALLAKVATENEAIESLVDGPDEPKKEGEKAGGKLMTDEEIALGHVSLESLMLYFSSMGGPGFWIAYLGAIAASDLLAVVQTWFLGFWASQYEVMPQDRVPVLHYLGIYWIIIAASVVCYSSGFTIFIYGSLNASRRIHERLTKAILGTTLRFLDKTPIGRVIARFTRDIRAVDGPLNQQTQDFSEITSSMVLKLLAIVYLTPVFLLPGLAIAVSGGILGQVYIKAQLAIKREMSNSRSPVFSHFGAAIGGLTSIRAYGAEEAFIKESLQRIDKYTRPARSFYNLNRWICIRIDALGGLFSAGLALYLLYVRNESNASNTGLQINLAVGFTGMLLWWVRIVNELEVQGSLERIQAYLDIEQEPANTESGKPPASWPTSGDLSVQRLSARYTPDGPNVLHELSFEIKSGEKVGVVGRTGSGKSSLTLSFLRLIPTDGEIFYDGIPVSSINLEALRGSITIIPQQPELLSGTLRQNLDPFDQHDDSTLNDALRAAGLFSLQMDLPEEERISLDSNVSSGGGNFSLGQRQILALARALVRQSKVLILDEATASLDHQTDTLVQNSLNTEFKDCTLITVAHRLQTIMNSDKILVLNEGRLVEFDSPANLLQKEDGVFKEMVDRSGDKETLYALLVQEPGASSH